MTHVEDENTVCSILLDAMAALDKEIEERKFQTSLLENAAAHIANAMKVGTKQEK